MMNCIQISRGVNKISMIIQLCSCLLNVLGKDSVNFDFWDFGFWQIAAPKAQVNLKRWCVKRADTAFPKG